MNKKFDMFILILSIYIVIEVAVEIVVGLPKNVIFDLYIIDAAVCAIFIFDWFYRFFKVKNKKLYTKKYLIDLIASIPFALILHPLRIFRVIRIMRSIKAIRGLRMMSPWFKKVVKDRASAALIVYSFLTSIIYFYCSLGLYNFENGANEKVRCFGDAMWLAFTSLTTVGYGDIYPVTWEGRIFAAVLILVGLGMFSLMTAEFATYIMSYVKSDKHESRES